MIEEYVTHIVTLAVLILMDVGIGFAFNPYVNLIVPLPALLLADVPVYLEYAWKRCLNGF